MDKSLKVEKDEWRERKRRTQNLVPLKKSELWSLILKWSKLKKCIHITSTYSLSVTQNWREISLKFEIEFVEPNFGAKMSLIMISEFQLWRSPLIRDQFQDYPLSVLRCHEACKAWRTCTKCYYMMWQWGVVSKCSPPPLKFNWIGLLPIQLNIFPNTNIKYSLSACEITKLPLIQKNSLGAQKYNG